MLDEIINQFIRDRQEALTRNGYDFSTQEVGMFLALVRSQELLRESVNALPRNSELYIRIQEFLGENTEDTDKGVALLASSGTRRQE